MNCNECKFSHDDGEGGPEDPIECRRYPPTLMPALDEWPEYFAFPTVERYEWCGEFKPKDEETFKSAA